MFRKKSGILVSFEGTEGSGKSTLIREVAMLMESLNYRTLQTREPGGSSVAEKLREIILHSSMTARTELFLYEAARAEHLEATVLPALEHGKVVLCDRFTDSTLAYQSYARGLPWKEVKALNRLATSGTKPDLTILLDIDPQVGLLRAKDPNRFEAEGLAFQKKVRSGYLKARSEDPRRWFTLKAGKGTPEQLAAKALREILKRFEKKLKKGGTQGSLAS